MPERKSGPVKPPTLDLEAREGAKKSESSTGTAKSKSDDTKGKPGIGDRLQASFKLPEWRLTLPLGHIAAGAVGTILGVAIAFAIAYFGLWPTSRDVGSDIAVAALERRVDTMETASRADAEDFSKINQRIDEFQDIVTALPAADSATFDALRAEIADLQVPETIVEAVDLSPLQNEIAALNSRLDAIAAGISSDDSDAFTGEIKDIRQQVTGFSNRVTDFEAHLQASSDTIDSFENRINDLTIAIAELPVAPTPAPARLAQLPLALSGLETAMLNGRPFTAELNALVHNLPDLEVPDSLSNAALDGLPSPQQIERQLAKYIPAMLTAMPSDPNASWSDRLLARAKSTLAMRPTGDVEGDSVQAIIARLETAVSRREFIKADAQMKALPTPMQLAAEGLPVTISLAATAEQFATSARSLALSPDTPTNNEVSQ